MEIIPPVIANALLLLALSISLAVMYVVTVTPIRINA